MKCDDCGTEIQVGDWPFCPHGPAGRFGEDPLSPYWDDELGAEITTRSGRRRIMAEKRLEYHDLTKKRRGNLYVCLPGR